MHFYLSAARRWLRFFLSAKTRYDLHSPFQAELIERVVEDQRWYYAFSHIEVYRRRWMLSRGRIPASAFGAGSQISKASSRKAGQILKGAAVDAETGRRLFRLALWQKPATILELGTSLGISSAYLASANRQAQVFTIEGQAQLVQLAKTHFAELELDNIRVFNGSFNEKLPEALQEAGKLDLVYIDGDHRQEPLLRYVRQCAEYRTDESVFVIADIHWSDEMERGWKQLCDLPEVTLTVDLYHFGLLFFRKEFKEKHNLAIVPAKCKPWRLGFWQ